MLKLTDHASLESLDFDAVDAADATKTDELRSIVFDLPARPGTLR